MAKWAFDDNVPRVRPRLKLGKALEETATEPPPARAETAEAIVPAEAPAPVEATPVATPAPVVEPEPTPEPVAVAEPEPIPEPVVAAAAEPIPEPVVAAAPEPIPEPIVAAPPEPVVAKRPVSKRIPDPMPEPVAAPIEAPVDVAPATALIDDPGAYARRSSLKRRAAGLGALPEPEPEIHRASDLLDDLDVLESAAELAVELERKLSEAAEANELLRRDLGVALDDLARQTSENKRVAEKVTRLETEGRDRAKVVQDLVRELELLEGERDAALGQASESALEIEALGERALLTERRMHELERSLADSQARTKRFEEAAAAQAAQRAALRAELDATRRERDQLLSRNAELDREREDLSKSRRALDEVHRALNDARQRASRIRPR